MLQLGYKEYVTQGGDWGFFITRALGLKYPESVRASHVNMLRANKPTPDKHPVLAAQHAATPYTDTEKKGFERSEWFKNEGKHELLTDLRGISELTQMQDKDTLQNKLPSLRPYRTRSMTALLVC